LTFIEGNSMLTTPSPTSRSAAAVDVLHEGLKQLEPAGSRGLRVEESGAGRPVWAGETGSREARMALAGEAPSGTEVSQ
jgi:hypothetical protein